MIPEKVSARPAQYGHGMTGHQRLTADRGLLKAMRRPPGDRLKRRNGRSKSWDEIALWQLPEAAEFTADQALCDPLQLIAEFRRHPFAAALRELTDTSPTSFGVLTSGVKSGKKLGRPRLAGDWPALYLSFVLSGCPAIQPFRSANLSTPLWSVCGFDGAPSYQEMHLRFGELEDHWEGFAAVAQALIQMGKLADERVGEVVMVDATGWHSPAALEDCCVDVEACKTAGGVRRLKLEKSVNEEVLEARWEEAVAEDDGASSRTRGGIERVRSLSGVVEYRLFSSNGHTYRSLDTTSGFRRYDGGTVWFGGYLQAAIDMFTGVPLAVEVFPADVQEYDGYPALYDSMVEALAEPPYVVSTDRGYGTRAFYEFNTRRGVAVVGPRRRRRNRLETRDWRTDEFDEHGIPRCRACGGEGDQESPSLGLVFSAKGEPLIRFRCIAPLTAGCESVQSIRCSAEWPMLLPLARTTELYHSVRWAHHNKEHAFRHARERYGVAGKDVTGRLRRRGVPPQRLRAWAAVLLDWFRLNLRHGWLPAIALPVSVAPTAPERLSGEQDRRSGEVLVAGAGTPDLRRLLRERRENALQLPYGRAATELQRRWERDRAA